MGFRSRAAFGGYLYLAAMSVLCLALVGTARADHPESDPCPDVHVNGGESLTQYLFDQNGDPIESGSTLVVTRDGNSPVTRVDVHGIAEVYGHCDTFIFHSPSQSCIPGSHFERTTASIKGSWTTPWAKNGTSNEFAIDENGFTTYVHVLDSQDDVIEGPGDTATSPGPITSFGSFPSFPGVYTHSSYSAIQETACALWPDFVQSTTASFAVVKQDDMKNLGCDDEAGVGNPCSARTGNKFESEEDYAGPALPFVRHYNSQSLLDLGLGRGWTSEYHRHLAISGGTLLAVRGTGRGEVFRKQPDGSWLGDADTRLSVTGDATGYTIARRDGWTERYLLDGRHSTDTDPSGNVTSYVHSPGGQLLSVTGPYGHSLSFDYDPLTGKLSQLNLPDGQAIQFAHTGNKLTSVTYPDLTTRSYHYENASFPHHLTGITDERGIRIATFAYGAQGQAKGRAISTQHAVTTNGSPQERFTLAYNGSFQTTVTDPRGNQEIYSFSAPVLGIKRLTQRTHVADGTTLSQGFDSRNNVTSRTDWLGRTTGFTWNATNQITSQTEAVGTPEERTMTYAYESPLLDLPTLLTRPSVAPGQTAQTEIVYDPLHLKPTSITDSGFQPGGTPVSRSVSLQYNAQGQLTEIDGPRSAVSDLTTFGYHPACATGAECGQLQSVQNALGHTTTLDSYDDHGRVTQTTDPHGTVTTYSYDDRGRLLGMTATPISGSARTWSFTYDAARNLETSTSPAGVVLTYSYDEANDLRSVEDADGNRVEYLYDLAGNRTNEKLRDESGTLQHEIQAAYDTRNRFSEINEGGSFTELVFDAVGQLTSQTDPNDHDTEFTHDALGRLQTRIDALSGVTDYHYSVDDSLSELTAPNSVATGYASDDLGNVLSEDSPDRGELAYAHDAAGNVTTFTHVDSGRTVAFSYDALNRILTRDYAGTDEDVAFTYDSCLRGIGRLCSIAHASGTTSFEYDAFGNVTKRTEVIEGDTYVTQYAYDGDDRVTQITYPSGHVVDYTRDGQGRIASVALDTVPITSNRTYRGDGRLLSQSWGNGLAETRTYNGLAQLATLAIGSVESETHTYDPAGNLTDRVGSAWTLDYGYDAIDRLTSDTGGAGSRAYTYDADGNRLTLAVDATPTTYTYTTGTNRLATVGGTTVTIDAEGRTTATATHAYEYNAAGRLESVETGTPLTEVGRYAYDAFGLRRTKLAGGGTTVYHYDEAGNLLLETDDAGAFLRLYVWADGTPVAQKAGSTLTRLHVDHLNTPRWGTDTSGALVWRWKSDGFGQAAPDEDVDGDLTDVVVNLRFPGQHHDDESGLSYNWHRYYEPNTGRYLRADPIGQAGGTNAYLYVLGMPTIAVDPRGLDILVIEGGGIASNPAGHTAAAVSGQGLYSFGTADPFGGSTTGYLAGQATYRDSELTFLKTTPAQDAAFTAAFNAAVAAGYDAVTNNCATAVNAGLTAAGIGGSLGPLNSVPGTAGARAQAASSQQNNGGNPTTVRIPKGGNVMPAASRFNPR